MGRGKSQKSVALILEAHAILKAIQPASVRAVCYQLFNKKLIPSMARTETNRVSTQLREARESGIIPWEWIVDETREAECTNAWENTAAYLETVKRSYRKDRWNDQAEHVEIWSEKGTVRGVLAPVLANFGVTFRVMHGYGSATALHDVAEQSADSNKPWTVLYVGDWDPSGLHMSELDLPERIARYGGDVEIVRVALTKAHCRSLGHAPSFQVESKRQDPRYRWFIGRHGRRCWELDALDPPTLRAAVRDAIVARLDAAAWERAAVVEAAEQDSIRTILGTWPGISGQASE